MIVGKQFRRNIRNIQQHRAESQSWGQTGNLPHSIDHSLTAGHIKDEYLSIL